MTDRTLVHLLPTTDPALFSRTVTESIGINRPPPSQTYRLGRATNFQALVPLAQSNFFSPRVSHRLAVVFTDGEAQPNDTSLLSITVRGKLALLFVHVSAPDEQIYDRQRGRFADPHYRTDPTSTQTLNHLASVTGGHAYSEKQFQQISHAARRAVGYAAPHAHASAYARVPLAPWFVLAGIIPLGFLLWKRNL